MTLLPLKLHLILSMYCSSSHNSRSCSPAETKSWAPYVQQITEPYEHAEEPTWDPTKGILYFVDIHQGLVVSFNSRNKEINHVKLGKYFGGLVFATPCMCKKIIN